MDGRTAPGRDDDWLEALVAESVEGAPLSRDDVVRAGREAWAWHEVLTAVEGPGARRRG